MIFLETKILFSKKKHGFLKHPLRFRQSLKPNTQKFDRSTQNTRLASIIACDFDNYNVFLASPIFSLSNANLFLIFLVIDRSIPFIICREFLAEIFLKYLMQFDSANNIIDEHKQYGIVVF